MLFPLSDRLIRNRAVKVLRVGAADEHVASGDVAVSDEDVALFNAVVLFSSDCRGSIIRGRP